VLSAAGHPNVVASPGYLLNLLRRSGRLPRINSIVDTYNAVSAKHGVVLSAHDFDLLSGPVRMVRVIANTAFEPIGSEKSETMLPGEFGVRDDTHFLCRMNCKQSRRSSITDATQRVLLYAQGHPAVSQDDLDSVIDEAVTAIIHFCGGKRASVLRRTV